MPAGVDPRGGLASSPRQVRKKMNMTQYQVPCPEDDNEQITFEADDETAGQISFADLVRLGYERAGGVEWVVIEDNEGPSEFPPPENDETKLRRWAWAFAVDRFTNYKAAVLELPQRSGFRLCEPCHAIEHGCPQNGEPLATSRKLDCEDCERIGVEALKTFSRRSDRLRRAVDSWVAARWPELEDSQLCARVGE